jgi:hypothetical protein
MAIVKRLLAGGICVGTGSGWKSAWKEEEEEEEAEEEGDCWAVVRGVMMTLPELLFEEPSLHF